MLLLKNLGSQLDSVRQMERFKLFKNTDKKKLLLVMAPAGLLLLFLAVVVFGGGAGPTPFGQKPQIEKVLPLPGAAEVNLWPEISVFFNQKVSPEQISFSSEPPFPFELKSGRGPAKTLIYQPTQSLAKITTYKITLGFKSGGGYTWSFTTSETEVGNVPGWEANFRKSEEEYLKTHPQEEVDIVNSLVLKLPYFTQNYWIEYFPRNDQIIVHLCAEPLEKTRGEAEEWLNQQGFDKLNYLKPKVDWYYGCQPPKDVPPMIPAP